MTMTVSLYVPGGIGGSTCSSGQNLDLPISARGGTPRIATGQAVTSSVGRSTVHLSICHELSAVCSGSPIPRVPFALVQGRVTRPRATRAE
jgi:hypothetical protein